MSTATLGRYQLLAILGQGAMGIVYRAYDPVLDREVAVKELLFQGGLDSGSLETAVGRFYTEARAAARLSHPTIVTVHDVGEEYGRLYLAMELLDGSTLRQVVDASGRLAAPDALYVLREIATAMAAAHAAGVVHRDIKPDNCFWLQDGRVKVGDFGIARIGGQDVHRAGTVMGTPGYMAPEQVLGREVGPEADVFSWGAVAYELLTGKPPFGMDDVDLVMQRILHEDPVDIRALGVPVPEELAQVVQRSLEKDPRRRYPDGTALATDLFSITSVDAVPRHAPAEMGSAAGSFSSSGPPGGRNRRRTSGEAPLSAGRNGSPRHRRSALAPLVVMIVAALGVMGLVGWLLFSQAGS